MDERRFSVLGGDAEAISGADEGRRRRRAQSLGAAVTAATSALSGPDRTLAGRRPRGGRARRASNGRRCFRRLSDDEVAAAPRRLSAPPWRADRPQRRRRRGLRALVARRRRRADAAHHLGQRRLRVPRRRPVDHAPHLRSSPPRTACVIGAQVGYPDLVGLRAPVHRHATRRADRRGRSTSSARSRRWPAAAGAASRYVKPHGALYNAIVHHEAQAAAVVDAMRRFTAVAARARPARLGRASVAASERGLRFVAEGFADRGYTRRRHAGATRPARVPCSPMPADVAAQARALVAAQVSASICVHSDTPGAAALAAATRAVPPAAARCRPASFARCSRSSGAAAAVRPACGAGRVRLARRGDARGATRWRDGGASPVSSTSCRRRAPCWSTVHDGVDPMRLCVVGCPTRRAATHAGDRPTGRRSTVRLRR